MALPSQESCPQWHRCRRAGLGSLDTVEIALTLTE